MGKPTIGIGENQSADQLRGNREADQRHYLRNSDSTIPVLLKSEISSFWLFSMLVQVGLCRTCSETTLLVFLRDGSILILETATTMPRKGFVRYPLKICGDLQLPYDRLAFLYQNVDKRQIKKSDDARMNCKHIRRSP